MARRTTSHDSSKPLPPPATTLEGREDQLTLMAYDLVEQRMNEGTASAQETVHFLRAGSRTNQLQLDKLKNENEVLKTRVKEMEARTSSDELLTNALNAFRGYSGQVPVDPEAAYNELEQF